MSVWDEYRARMEVIGNNRRSAHYNRGAYSINSHLPNSLSYFDVTIDGKKQTVAIMNSDNLNEKTIISLPGEDIRHGGLVHWMDQYWLITEKDYNTIMYGKGYLLQCNFMLKWITEDGVIHEQWCCVEDGTKLRRLVSAHRDMRDKYPLNCWKVLKLVIQQHNDEICISVNVAKAERNYKIVHGVNPKHS